MGPGQAYRIWRLEGAKGQGEFVFPWPIEGVDRLRRGLEVASYRSLGAAESRNGRPSARLGRWQALDPKSIGGELSAALFEGEIGQRFREERAVAVHRKVRCRLALRLDPTVSALARLMTLPWELLTDPENGEFLLPDRRWPLVRSLDVSWPHTPQPPATGPLRLLVISAQPKELPRLAAAEEIGRIRAVCDAGRGIHIEVLDHATAESLRPALEKGVDLLHFIGHGSVNRSSGEGYLALEDAHGGRRDLAAAQLARLCQDLTELRLVTLNACDSALVAGGDVQLNPFASVATALIQQGVPGVVAMQWTVSDSAGIRFGEALYRQLARTGDLLEAVEAGRHAIRAADPGSLEWATPVLYLHNQALVRLAMPRRSRRWGWVAAGLATLILVVGVFWPRPAPSPAPDPIYQLRVIPLDPEGQPLEGVEIRVPVLSQAQRVDLGWEVEIPAQAIPEDRTIVLFLSKESAFLEGRAEITLGEDLRPRLEVPLTKTLEEVRGRVLDEQGQVIVGARVNVVGFEEEEVPTSTAGAFTLPAHKARGERVRLRVTYAGFAPKEQYHRAGTIPATIILFRENGR